MDTFRTVLLYLSAMTLPWLIYETWLDIVAARAVMNGRMAMAKVRMVRLVTITLIVFAGMWLPGVELRRAIMAALLLVLVLSEVYLRRALRSDISLPSWGARLLWCWANLRGDK